MRIPDKPQWRGVAEDAIDEAISRGEFANLKGKGKPLNIQGDLADKNVMRTKLRHDSGMAPAWEDIAREIERARALAVAEMKRALEFRNAGRKSARADQRKIEADFQQALLQVKARLEDVNSQILRHNLLLPRELPHLYRKRQQLEDLFAECGYVPGE